MGPFILSMISSKGGVGKTTTCLNLAAALMRRGLTVAVYDADPSRSASLICADGMLGFTVEALALEDGEPKSIARWSSAIRATKVDFIMLDAPGSLGLGLGAALAIAHLALVPSGASLLDLRGAAESISLVRRHKKATGTSKPDILVVPSRIDKRTGAGRDAVGTLASLTEPVSPAISYRAIVADSFVSGLTVPANSESAHEFDALASAVLTRLGVDQ